MYTHLAILAAFVFIYSAVSGRIDRMPISGPNVENSCFAVAQTLGGSGFIASFSGGLLFGWSLRSQKRELLGTAEGTGNILALVTWVVFGSAVVGQIAGRFSWRIVLYAVLSLTLVRMVPVILALTGSGVRRSGKLFMGWFGPRGLASIVFIVIVINEQLPGNETLALVVACTVLLSILAHGFSASPLIAALGARDGSKTTKSSGTTNSGSSPKHGGGAL